MAIQPFEVAVSDEVLSDLRERLARARWPDELSGQGDRYGVPFTFVRRVCEHWRDSFDWRAQEARLNAWPQFRAQIDGVRLHLVLARSEVPDATPLLLTNGWPSSIFEYLDILPRLTAAGFHVIAPALPGYGFSDRPTEPGMNPRRIAELFAGLMTELGYPRFFMHGSDLGAGVTEQMRRHAPDRLLGVHFSNVWWGYPQPDDASSEERAYFEQIKAWQAAEGAYAMEHATKPQTLSVGLTDSPAGLAAWILEKVQSWSDGDAEEVFGLDGLCADLTVYWVTETIASSVRLYAEAAADRSGQAPPEKGDVPAGVIVFPRDILPAPRAWGERNLPLAHWTEASRGGHFPAWEQPELLAEDIAAFARAVAMRNAATS